MSFDFCVNDELDFVVQIKYNKVIEEGNDDADEFMHAGTSMAMDQREKK